MIIWKVQSVRVTYWTRYVVSGEQASDVPGFVITSVLYVLVIASRVGSVGIKIQ